MFAAVEPARAEREDPLAGRGVLPGRINLGDDLLTVAESCNSRVEFGEVPVGELCERALDERPVVGRGRRVDILWKRRAELLASAAVGRVVFVVGQRLLTAGDAAAMDGNRPNDIDATAALRTLLRPLHRLWVRD